MRGRPRSSGRQRLANRERCGYRPGTHANPHTGAPRPALSHPSLVMSACANEVSMCMCVRSGPKPRLPGISGEAIEGRGGSACVDCPRSSRHTCSNARRYERHHSTHCGLPCPRCILINSRRIREGNEPTRLLTSDISNQDTTLSPVSSTRLTY